MVLLNGYLNLMLSSSFKCSVSYENIDFVQGDDFEANTAKIWEKRCRMSLFISFILPVCKRAKSTGLLVL